MPQSPKTPAKSRLTQFNLKTLFVWGAASQLWLLLFIATQTTRHISAELTAIVLVVMTAGIYRLVRYWKGAIAWAALLAGLICLGSLGVASLLTRLYG